MICSVRFVPRPSRRQGFDHFNSSSLARWLICYAQRQNHSCRCDRVTEQPLVMKIILRSPYFLQTRLNQTWAG